MAAFEDNLPLLAEITTPVLVHGDLWRGNVLISEDCEKVVAIIDGDRAVFRDPAFEFANPWITSEAFIAGYGKISLKVSPM